MRIGTIAQHSNIGPTRPDNIITNSVPGRLNDFPIWVWYDFTDPMVINNHSYPGGSPTTSTAFPLDLVRCADKGPYGALLQVDSAGKGPDWYDANFDNAEYPSDAINSQDNYSYIRSVNNSVGYLQFTAPADLKYRDLSVVIVLDKFGTPAGDEYLFQFISSGRFIYIKTDSSNRLSTGFGHSSGGSAVTRWDNFWTDTVDGDSNSNFTWLVLTSEWMQNGGFTTFQQKLYSRGTLYSGGKPGGVQEGMVDPSFYSGLYPEDNVIAEGGYSVILGNNNNTQTAGDSNSPSTYMYEFLVYEKALTQQDLYSIDRYMGDKYGSYSYGRFGDI